MPFGNAFPQKCGFLCERCLWPRRFLKGIKCQNFKGVLTQPKEVIFRKAELLSLQPLCFLEVCSPTSASPSCVCSWCGPGTAAHVAHVPGREILQKCPGTCQTPRAVVFSPGCAAPAALLQKGSWQCWELATTPSRNCFVGSPGSPSIWDTLVHKCGNGLSGNCGLDYSKIPE